MPPRSRSQRPYNPAVSRDSESPTREALGKRPRPSADRPLESGTLLGERYKIESVLGYGGMGVVYRARDVKLDCDIALKRIRPDRMSPERQQTLRQEIILSRRVTHENVCRVYDLVELDGEEFVSMEFVPGRSSWRARPGSGPRARDRQEDLPGTRGGPPHRRAAPG